MSQITRCPSCATTFKVVADQLRISEGWVRCGQCKEVFDASAHLVVPVPAPVVPRDAGLVADPGAAAAGIRSTGSFSPPRSAGLNSSSLAPDVATAVSSGRDAGPANSLPIAMPPAAVGVPGLPPRFAHHPPDQGAMSAPPEVLASAPGSDIANPLVPPDTVRSLDVPAPAVPAFLSAAALAPDAIRPQELSPSFLSGANREPLMSAESRTAARMAVLPGDTHDPADPPHSASLVHKGPAAGASPPAPTSNPGGYELPFADLRAPDEADWLSALPEPPVTRRVETSSGDGFRPSLYPALDLARRATGRNTDDVDRSEASPVDHSTWRRGAADGLHPGTGDDDGEERMVRSVSMASQAGKPPLVALDRLASHGGDDEPADDLPAPEVSFVVSARRKAFWQSPLMRLTLGLLLLLMLSALAAQMAIHERDRIAATEPRLRPWLSMLCEPVGCELAPRRQIADVVIDSSSFNKARGDSYLLNLTLRNQAAIPLAMPAMELTLTDAQDQPVLRRILLPNDMGAPAEMPARGEWSASVSVVVTTGGARVAGYRLLAFYP